MNPQELQNRLRGLRVEGRYADARALVAAQPGFTTSKALQRLHYEHQDFWWEPLVGRRVTLKRRGAADVALVRACWADTDFMRRFNRLARPLPAEDRALAGILMREQAGTLGDSKALHWTVHAARGAVGFVSVTDYVSGHRRAEFLIGFLQQPASAAPVEAAHLACDFLYRRAGIERLTAHFYAENEYAAKVAEKFGFRREGVLRGYIRDPDGGRSDLLVSGMLLAEQTQGATRRRFTRS
ncbi:MAG: GNAT family N-acetyltransferase [Burkholderiales bacterium]|nr:GNAT family N-acetyltransferase [Burkholderiales bacterium]